MAPNPHADAAGSAGGFKVTHHTAVEFADLLVADDEWVRREFDAIVAAGWGGVVPPCPAPSQGAHWPRRPGYDVRPTPVERLRGPVTVGSAQAHERGPPD
jgi:hypothetical protein